MATQRRKEQVSDSNPSSEAKTNDASSPSRLVSFDAAPPQPSPSFFTTFFSSRTAVYGAATALRLVLLVYGLWQDANSPVKYTDIDYLVFTDAARFVAHGKSPYDRETYRYTPLLAWLLLPAGIEGIENRWLAEAMFASGKVLFVIADLLAGWLMERVLLRQLEEDAELSAESLSTASLSSKATQARTTTALKYASVWLLNPMVAAISTRGSAEGLLGALVAALLWAVQVARRPALGGFLLGLGVHLKIYPFIYAPAIFWWMDDEEMPEKKPLPKNPIVRFFTPSRLIFTAVSLVTFLALNATMYLIYGFPFLQHTYLHHVTRIDHRHNFSVYNTQLYLSSAREAAAAALGLPPTNKSWSELPIESLAFIPQLLLSCFLLPLVLAKKDLASTMLAQTFAFVTFNKVCTSQYFLWYMVLLPTYLPRSSLVADPKKGLLALALWVGGQAAWLQQAYGLEFLGHSTFIPGLWYASIGFFFVNCWILSIIIDDIAMPPV